MDQKITLLPGWSVWDGCVAKGTFHRKVFEQLTANRQLVGYLSHLLSADLTVFALNVEEDGLFAVNVTSFQCGLLARHELRICYAESCYRSFKSHLQPETVQLAVVA